MILTDTTCLYSAHDKYCGVTKIGVTGNIKQRLTGLRTSGYYVELVSYVIFRTRYQALAAENLLTTQNMHNWVRLHGREWFWTGGAVHLSPNDFEGSLPIEATLNGYTKRAADDITEEQWRLWYVDVARGEYGLHEFEELHGEPVDNLELYAKCNDMDWPPA